MKYMHHNNHVSLEWFLKIQHVLNIQVVEALAPFLSQIEFSICAKKRKRKEDWPLEF
jgi:hypothetical protein